MIEDIPLWVAIVVSVLLVLGSALTLLGCIGITFFKDFYDRLHMPTLGTSWGVGCIIIGSMIYATLISGRLVVHEILITVFFVVTTPVTLMMLSRAAIQRDHSDDVENLTSEIFDAYRRRGRDLEAELGEPEMIGNVEESDKPEKPPVVINMGDVTSS